MQGANLIAAKMRGAILENAQMQEADLYSASMQQAFLDYAQMQGANLMWAKMQGADLTAAQLQGADLSAAQLQGAVLSRAWLQGAVLSGAQLQGADLTAAQLQGANLKGAHMQGADLSQAYVWQTVPPGGSEATVLDFKFFPPNQTYLQATLASFNDEGISKRGRDRLSPLLDPAKVRAWADTPDHEVWARMRNSPLPAPTAIAKVLGDLACGDRTDGYIMRGVARRALSGSYYSLTAAKLVDLDLEACPAAKHLDEQTWVRLRKRVVDASFQVGRAYYNGGDFNAAAPHLSRPVLENDIYRMLWLFLAQSRVGQDATKELTANAENLQSKDWPYPVIDLYLGKRSPGITFAMAGNSNERCEAQFYIGEWHLMHGREDEALPLLQSAVEMCPKNFFEYEGAVAELGRIEETSKANAGVPQNQ